MHGITRQTSHACRFNEAVQSEQISEANAMCIATATPEGRPSNRMVLMKGYDQRGFKFYSNYSSRKGQELERNSYASLCFWWEPLHRSVGLFPSSFNFPAAHAVFCAVASKASYFGSILRAAVADLVCC
jgi:pyridoxine/pyridoxamine 5'-phosphate oxidase